MNSKVKMTNDSILAVGETLPSITLLNQHGEEINLRALTSQFTVIYVYPKDNTPGCTNQTKLYQSLLKDFKTLGAQIIGVSPDSVQSHAKFAQKYGVEFNLLSDPQRELIKALGAIKGSALLGKTLTTWRSSFILGGNAKIIRINRGVKAKEDPEGNLEFLRELSAA